MQNFLFSCAVVLEDEPLDVEVLPADERLDGAHLQGPESVLHTEAVAPGVLADLVKVPVDQLLLLDELDIGQRLGRQLDGLVEAVLAAVAHVNKLDDFGLQKANQQWLRKCSLFCQFGFSSCFVNKID